MSVKEWTDALYPWAALGILAFDFAYIRRLIRQRDEALRIAAQWQGLYSHLEETKEIVALLAGLRHAGDDTKEETTQ